MKTCTLPEYLKQYGHLPGPFQPHDFAQHGARIKWRTAIRKSLPVPVLPRGLELRDGSHYQPPRFDYGWKMTCAELSAMGEKLGLEPRADTYLVTEALTEHLLTLGLGAPHVRIDAILTGGCAAAGPSFCVTFADNYHVGDAMPPLEIVEAVKKLAGLEDEVTPGWYLDKKWSHWHWQSSAEILSEDLKFKTLCARRH